MRPLYFFILLLFCMIFLCRVAAAQDWPTAGGSSERNGLGNTWGPGIVTNPLWDITNASSTVWGNAIFSFNDRFATSRVKFSPSYHVTVECRKITDGSLIWEKSFPDDGKLYVVGMTEDAVYVHNYATDSLFAFDPANGAIKWVCPEKAKIFGGAHPIVFACNGDPVVNGPDSYTQSLMRIDRNTGEVLWYNTNWVSVMPGPDFCIFGDRLYKWEGAIGIPTHLVAVDLNTGGNLFYSDAIPGDADQELPLTAGPDGTIYGQRDGGDLWAFTDLGNSFAVKWSHTPLSSGMGTYGNIAIGTDGSIYYPDGKVITKLDQATGSVVKTSVALSTSNMTGTFMAVDPDGILYVSNSEAAGGKYFAFSPDLQTKLWELAVPMNYYAGPQLNRDGIFLTAGSGTRIRAYVSAAPHPPAPDFTADKRTILGGESLQFTDISSYAPTGWSWSFPGGEPSFSGLQQPPLVRYDVAGTYPVTLIAANANGADTLTRECYIQVATSVGISILHGNNEFTVYPNPSDGKFTLSTGSVNPEGDAVTISDTQGRIVFKGLMKNRIATFGAGLPAGLYFIGIDGTPGSVKLIIRK